MQNIYLCKHLKDEDIENLHFGKQMLFEMHQNFRFGSVTPKIKLKALSKMKILKQQCEEIIDLCKYRIAPTKNDTFG